MAPTNHANKYVEIIFVKQPAGLLFRFSVVQPGQYGGYSG